MLPRTLSTIALGFTVSLVAAGPAAAQFPQVLYELQSGSRIIDACVTCERPTIESHIGGTLILERLPVRVQGELYEISALELSSSDPREVPYSIQGQGSYHRIDDETQRMGLTLTVNGIGGIALESGPAAAATPRPMIDVTVTEDGTRDPSHKLTLRILAAPKVELTSYELVKGNLNDGSGSILELICPPCELAHPFIPLEGTLLAGLVWPVDDGFSVYRLDAIRLRSLLPDAEYTIVGSGSYEEGGDAEILKQARLTVEVNGGQLRELTMREGPVAVKPGGAFPTIDVEVEETERNTLWYRIHLVAKPGSAQPITFRRGDTNSDGGVDISDAVYHLLWRFAGGPAPSCLEAADSNADGLQDLTDAVFTLDYLFRGGPAPPAPGPGDCGEAPSPRFSCDSQPPCANA